MRVLGIHDGHNAAAVLLEDGVVRAGIQEERLCRVKNQAGFPHGSVRWVLESTGTDPASLDFVAMHSTHSPYPKSREAMIAEYAASQSLGAQVKQLLKRTPANALHRGRRRAARLAEIAKAGLPRARVRFVDHHTCHAAAAYHGSPWKDEKVLVLTADGMGDDLCASVRVGEKGMLGPPIATVADSHSLGSIYAKVTFVLGMVPNEHEYKLMGMAPYAPEAGAAKSYERFRNLLQFNGANGLTWKRAPGMPHTYYSYRFFRDLVERHRFDWVMAGLQRFTEEHLVAWAKNAVRATGVRKLALGGGVFMNVKANQRIYELPEVDGLFVFPSCGDEMNSVGAAFQVQAEERARRAEPAGIPPLGPVYWGPEPDENELAALLPGLRAKGYRVDESDDVETLIADGIARGEVVARAAGRMEFGARALGNRSILADPTRKDVIRIINDMIKNRDFWMPFAPAMLAERSDEYVVNPKRMDAPYMIMTFPTTGKVDEFPAGVQPYDHSARPQFVHREQNPDFHRIISKFAERTGRAVVLNTSFNLHGYPIVASARDAVEVLENSGLVNLAVGRYFLRKPDAAS
jgi:carbamoyltransferase